jgi:myo-inositol-1(or 4)-monophosphatase
VTWIQDVHAVALDASQAGAEAIKDVLDGPTLVIQDKGTAGQDLVTNADRASEAAIIDIIKARRGTDAILAEESGETSGTSGVRWVVDPLDGTTNFAHGGAYYAVSIAAESAGRVITAIIRQPERDRWLAWGPDGIEGSHDRVGVRRRSNPAQALVSFAVPYDAQRRRQAYRLLSDVAPRVHDLRNLGSTACDLSAVAVGDLDVFVGFDQKPWDTAAGIALVEAAGGASRTVARTDGLEILIAGGVALVDVMAAWFLDCGHAG